jgi:hypothetical protein
MMQEEVSRKGAKAQSQAMKESFGKVCADSMEFQSPPLRLRAFA